MNLQQQKKLMNLLEDLSFYFKWASSASFFLGAMNHELKRPFVIAAGVLMLCSLICFLLFVKVRKKLE